MLRYLVEHPGRLISHDELLDALWPETYVQPQVLRTYVLELRKILGDDARQPRFIQSLPKRGYRFLAAVTGADSGEGTHQPTTPQPDGLPALTGRAEELKALQVSFDTLAQDKRQIVFLTGETGIGKSALLEAFCRTLEREQLALVVRGQCVQGVADRETYYPVMELLSDLCGPAHTERTKPCFESKAPAWLAAANGQLSAGMIPAQERAISDLCAAFEAICAETPLVLVLEDLHWADTSTLNLIAALARRRAPARLMLLATVGPHKGDAAELKRMMRDLLVHDLSTELRLEPLRPAQVEALLREILEQDDLPPDLVSFVHESSEGNPLFANAMVRHLQAERFLVRAEREGVARWEARAPLREMEAGIPDELKQMIELELEHLSPREQSVLEAASLFSVAFPAWAVAAALQEDLAPVEEACDAIARRFALVKRAGQDELPDGTGSAFYVFAHGLYRDVLYQRQTLALRARSHVRIAERLRVLFAGSEDTVAPEVAWHYEAAGQRALAIATLRDAAQQAVQQQMVGAAIDLLEYALRIAEGLHRKEREPVTAALQAELLETKSAACVLEDPACADQKA